MVTKKVPIVKCQLRIYLLLRYILACNVSTYVDTRLVGDSPAFHTNPRYYKLRD